MTGLPPNEGFAVVGYAVRVPGAADADEFWEVLRDGRDAVSEVPADRWDVEEFYDPDPDAPGKIVTRRAGFIDDATGFDAPFFGLSKRETMLIDPQHRLLLETAWQAVEHSGTAPSALANTKTGVFMGLGTHDYLQLIAEEVSYDEIDSYQAIGSSAAAGAGRISYAMGLQGPAVSVDTACSSSLVAVHQACQALRFGECDVALAGGANVLLSPKSVMSFARAKMLAPDGKCKTFDASADGYVRGEGCGVIVLKRLKDAVRDGDRIRAVIRGSAINQDGASGGLTVPNGVAQQRVISEALACAGVAAADVGYLEAHGTGTSLGDPIEVQAAGAVLGDGRDADRPLLIGSVKTNIGHLEAAAGIAGLIKVILSLEHEQLPKHLHFQKPSPHIPWDRLAVRVVDESIPWPRDGRPRIAGVSSFGFSGTNSHIILEEAPAAVDQPAEPTPAPADDRRFSVLPLSARSPEALVQLAQRYNSWLTAHPEAALADVCFTAGVARSHFEHRAALVVNSTESAREALRALAEDRPAPGLLRGECADRPKTAWLFTGQGSQYAGMARELFDTEPVFAETMTRCAAAVADVLEKPLLDVIFDVDSPDAQDTIRQTSYAQPALFAVEMGLARLWQSWGFEPDVVIGHSVGQYTAACVAGVFSLEDGMLLMAERGRLFGSLPAGGRMAAVFAAAERVEGLTDEFPSLSVAAYNGANTVLSGPGEDLARAVAKLEDDGVRCDWLDTSHAFHSALLDPVLDEFEAYANRFEFGPPRKTLVCNRTGTALGRKAKLDGAYWRRHARQPVEFAKSVRTLADLHCTVLLEIGPQPVLTAAAMRAWPDPATAPRAIASLRRNIADHRQITEAVANAYIAGHRPDFAALTGPARKLDLPTYPFQHRQYWFREKRGLPTQTVDASSAARTETVRLLEDGRINELAALLDGADGDQQALDLLKALAAHHNQERNALSITDTRYEIRWEKSAAWPARGGEGCTWLLICDDEAAAAPLVDALTARGHRHQVLGVPLSDADEERLSAALRTAAADEPTTRILNLAALDTDPAPSTQSLLRMQHQVLSGTRRLFRAAAAAQLRVPIWLITRGAQDVTGADTVSPAQSALWGFGRAAALEHPRLWGGLVDLSATGAVDKGTWSGLIDQLLAAPAGEDQIALRDQGVYVARLTRRTGQPSAAPIELRGDATYLVTGGLGAIGMEVAGYLATQGARHLVLTSRRAPSDTAQQRIDAIREQSGCDIRVITADVANPHDVARVLTTVRAELPPLAGIVHAAGVISTTPLQTLDDDEVGRVFGGKVWGAWNLTEATEGLKLDFFLSTSSIAGVWGAGGQTAYSAANAFLDGLAWRQRERGVPGISVNFGPWLNAGMADEAARAELDKRGVRPLSPADALAGMAELLASSRKGASHGVVARIDWANFLPVYQIAGKRSFFTQLQREVPDSTPQASEAASTQLVERVTAAPVQQRKKLVVDYLRDVVAEVTRIDAAEIRDEAGFFDVGMDSLMAVELRHRVQRAVGKELPSTLAMDYPRLVDVADFLLSDVLNIGAPVPSVPAPAQPAPVAPTRSDEPIAIVSVACRFPGASDPEAYWDLLSRGVDAIREIPDDRFDVDEYYDPDPEAPGKIYTRYGGYLDSVDGFDPEFFGISPREAVWMDPQQRLMLEIAWEGLERAGYSPSSLRGSRSGVFVGVAANEYSQLLGTNAVETIEAHFITGNALNVIAGRVAFALGLEGPAMAVDTACSASLVAVHQACQALHSGDCDMALAGGVNVLVSPASIVATSRARMLSADGRCKTFDAAANGYARSEGCGILVLKRLSDAQRDGDPICAVIRGSAVNQDGASSGLTVPNGGAQQRLIAEALARAGLTGGDVDYLEAHGTGTSLGDPIEVQAAAAAYGVGRDGDRPLLIGSVKTNVGHLESAAGIAGLIKVVLALQHEALPQNLHFENPSPNIPWDALPVRVVDKMIPWRPNGRPRRAGTSSFGFSGTNAHVLIEEAPATSGTEGDFAPDTAAEQVTAAAPISVLPLSARSPEALTALARRYADWFDAHPDVDVADVSFTAGAGRSHFEHRAALVVDSAANARELLVGLAENRLEPGAVRGQCGDPPKTAWLFTGQGSQYPGMARELFDTSTVFAETVTRCAEAVEGMLPRPLLEVLFETDNDTNSLGHTSYAQPALFAVEMGLARLWQSLGIEPDVVLGHSVGQYAAACVAGVFSLEEGARLMAERGRLFGELPEGGRMVAVFTAAEQVERATEGFPQVSVAAYNGPNTVLSGPAADLEQIVARLDGEGIRCTWLDTSHAFHSVLLEPALDEFEAYANKFDFAVPTLPLVCNRTGAVLTADTPLDAQYWRRHSRQPVQFAESVQTVAQLGCSVLMEIGPQPVLTGAAVQAWPESSAAPRAIACLRKGADDRRQMAEALAAVYVAGHRPDFAASHHQPRRRVELPTYPFQRRRFWPKTVDIRTTAGHGVFDSGILGEAKDLASGDTVYTGRWSVKSQPWLSHHVIYGTVVVPGATYAAMALAAVGAPAQVREVFFYEPIILPEKASREVQLTLRPLEDGSGSTFQVHSRPYGERDAEWSLNADGRIATDIDDEPASEPTETIEAACERLRRTRPQQLFDTFADMELIWGPTWSGSLKSLWAGDGEAVGDVAIGEELAEQLGSEPIHPVLLDLCTGVAFPAFPAVLAATEEGGPMADLFLPLRYGRVTLREKMPKRFYCRARWQTGSAESETQVFDLEFVDRSGRLLGEIREFAVKRAPREALLRGLGGDATRNLYTLGWQEMPPPAQSDDADQRDGTWLVAGFDELSAALPGSVTLDRTSLSEESWAQAFTHAGERGAPVRGIVWRSAGRPGAEESATEFAERLENEIDQLLTALRTLQSQEDLKLTGGLWLVTERAVATESSEPVDPAQAAMWGLGRTIMTEQPALRCRLLDYDTLDDVVGSLPDLLGAAVDEPELALRQGKYLVPRMLPWARGGPLPVPRGRDYILEPTERGAIDNLRLVEIDVPPPPAGQVQIRVEAAGLNFRDVLNVLGLYPGDPGRIGGDLAGVVTEVGDGVTGFEVGQRVFGFMQGGFASRVNIPFQFLSPLPDGVSAIGAATIPAGALTTRLAFDWAEVGPGDRVLIHAASGGVGLAAIQLAQQAGATVFATASTYKRATLRDMGVEYVYDSRSTDFADQILADTDGAGVDVVLNSLTNEGFIEATVRATAPGGRFAEIAKRDIWTPEQMAAVRPDIKYEIIALDATIEQEPERVGNLLAELADSMGSGALAPLAAEVYPLTEAKTAFRRMQQARHIGKIVLQMPKPLQPREDRSYLITGGLGALGLYTAAHLAQLGAGDIVLTSRRTPDADAQRAIADITERYRCRIHTFAADVGDESEVVQLLERIRAELPPLGGVVHGAGVLDDALLTQQSVERFRNVLAPKALGAHHLHRLTKNDDLEFFIVYSSAASVLGSPGQANYVTANAFLDGLVAERNAHGLPATSVNWGPWAQGGMATSRAARANLSAQGLIPLEPTAALTALSEILAHGTGQVTVLKANWQRAAKGLGGSRPFILDHLLPSAVAATRGDSELLRQLHDVPEEERGSFLTEYLRYEVQNFLRLAQPPAATSRFLELGTDSLMAVEFSNRLLPQFGGVVTISATAVFDYPTIGSLAEYLAGQVPEPDDAESIGTPE
ncbi:type I polyketide synthase [Mycolicibacterium pulveris]|uniref:type I polyketide synthase n=1 Tax=Mycolicibacterium pulveris TaxID=36813 RepID=UPI003CF409A7